MFSVSSPFVCECYNISTMPRLQFPLRQTQRANHPTDLIVTSVEEASQLGLSYLAITQADPFAMLITFSMNSPLPFYKDHLTIPIYIPFLYLSGVLALSAPDCVILGKSRGTNDDLFLLICIAMAIRT